MTTILAFEVPPAPTDDFNSGPAVFGNDFKANAVGRITGVWYYHHLNGGNPATVTVTAHRQSDQQLLKSKATPTGGLANNAWNFIAFDSALSYPTPDELITLSAYWPLGGFSYKTGQAERTANGLTAVVGSIGRFKNNATVELDYPIFTSGGLACPVGMEFEFTGAPAPVQGGWEQLVAITHERMEYQRLARITPPQACPNDGEPLQRIGSILHCPFDGWQWPRDGDGIK